MPTNKELQDTIARQEQEMATMRGEMQRMQLSLQRNSRSRSRSSGNENSQTLIRIEQMMQQQQQQQNNRFEERFTSLERSTQSPQPQSVASPPPQGNTTGEKAEKQAETADGRWRVEDIGYFDGDNVIPFVDRVRQMAGQKGDSEAWGRFEGAIQTSLSVTSDLNLLVKNIELRQPSWFQEYANPNKPSFTPSDRPPPQPNRGYQGGNNCAMVPYHPNTFISGSPSSPTSYKAPKLSSITTGYLVVA